MNNGDRLIILVDDEIDDINLLKELLSSPKQYTTNSGFEKITVDNCNVESIIVDSNSSVETIVQRIKFCVDGYKDVRIFIDVHLRNNDLNDMDNSVKLFSYCIYEDLNRMMQTNMRIFMMSKRGGYAASQQDKSKYFVIKPIRLVNREIDTTQLGILYSDLIEYRTTRVDKGFYLVANGKLKDDKKYGKE